VASFFLAAFLTTAGVVVLVYPNFSAALAKDAPLALPAATGWIYSSIVVVILAAMLWQNWPWAMLSNRHLRALGAAAVTLGGGVLVAWIFRGIVGALTPTHIEHLPTFSRDLEAAQLGVCFSLWGLTWGLVWGARPTRFSTTVNRLASTAIVTVLSVATYWVFVNFAAVDIYHFPAVADGNYGGSPLLFIDWVIMALLWYAVAFGGYGSTRREVSVPEAGA
jgi:amino acid transporter, AAT family